MKKHKFTTISVWKLYPGKCLILRYQLHQLVALLLKVPFCYCFKCQHRITVCFLLLCNNEQSDHSDLLDQFLNSREQNSATGGIIKGSCGMANSMLSADGNSGSVLI